MRKGAGPLKLYRYACTPTGTIFDPLTSSCKEPRAIRPIPPECAKWDDTFRLIFEEILNQETEDEEVGLNLGKTADVWNKFETPNILIKLS